MTEEGSYFNVIINAKAMALSNVKLKENIKIFFNKSKQSIFPPLNAPIQLIPT